jgi:nicotinamidase/pyrazinamidase
MQRKTRRGRRKMKIKLTDKDALVLVDMQNDFMPYGVLPV